MQLDGELGPVVEKSFKKFIKLLDDHLKKHLFIFGDRPSIGDFAIAGQLIQMMKDPTPAKIIEKDGEFVAKWCEFMSAPTASGPFAALDDLKETLAPIFADDLAAFFLPWAAENLENSLAGAETFDVSLGKDNHARSAALGRTLLPRAASQVRDGPGDRSPEGVHGRHRRHRLPAASAAPGSAPRPEAGRAPVRTELA